MICDECETVAHCMKNGCVPKTTKKDEALKLALEALEHLQPTALTSFYTIGDRDRAITALREALAEQPAIKQDLTPEQQEPQRWAAYSEGDERVTAHDTEGEACGEKECDIDNDFEPGTEVEYLVAPMISAKQLLRTRNAHRIGERIFEDIDENLADCMGAEDSPLSIDKEDTEELGKMVIDFLCARGKTQWWTVDHKREEKRTYIAGSNDEAAHGIKENT